MHTMLLECKGEATNFVRNEVDQNRLFRKGDNKVNMKRQINQWEGKILGRG